MKILKKVLCILLSSMFLLFAGACNYDNGPSQTYEDHTSNEYVGFKVTADKTTCYGEKSSVRIECHVTIKKPFWLYSGQTKEPEDFIYIVALNDKLNVVYYTAEKYLQRIRYYKSKNVLYNSEARRAFGQSLTIRYIEPNTGSISNVSFHQRRYFDETVDYRKDYTASKGKYRLYLAINSLYLENPYTDNGFKEGVTRYDFLIPTDIVLNMK